MERLEGNKLIADFIGWVHSDSKEYDEYEMQHLKYHTSWDWLMPVVEKIEAIGPYWIKISETNCKVMKNIDTLLEADGKTKIQAVWQAVIQFIQTENN